MIMLTLKLNGRQNVQLKWTDLASTDLDIIEKYITEENSIRVAIDVVLHIIESVQVTLNQFPRAGRQGRVMDTRELVIKGLPYVVVYRENINTSCIEILRVLHHAQQWPKNK